MSATFENTFELAGMDYCAGLLESLFNDDKPYWIPFGPDFIGEGCRGAKLPCQGSGGHPQTQKVPQDWGTEGVEKRFKTLSKKDVDSAR